MIWAVLVAAGSGHRFGGPKQHVRIGGLPMWERAEAALVAGGVDRVVRVGEVPSGVPGGDTRRASVAAGMAVVPDAVEWILVHDAARPLAPVELVRRVIARLEAGDVDAVVPAVGVRDTIKQVDGDRVVATLDRSRLVAVQTPQGFRAATLRAAHRDIPGDATDDAALVEAWGGAVVTVPGDPINLKVTYPEDLVVAEALVASRERAAR